MQDFFEQFLRDTTGEIYICSLPNPKTDGVSERHITTRDISDIEIFKDKWDQRGRGLFFCVSTIKSQKSRNKSNVSQVVLLHADTDAKDILVPVGEAAEVLTALELPPSRLHMSGRGLHSFWYLDAPTDQFERVEDLLKRLCAVVAGDKAVTHIAALMRLPGSHNTKDDAWTEVTTYSSTGQLYTLDEIEAWLDRQAPVLERKVPEGGINPFLRAADMMAYKAPLDIDARLEAMSYKGEGENSIHTTQLSVTASMMQRGHELEEVVSKVLEATKKVGEEDWDWRKEERIIRKMCEDWEVKAEKKVVNLAVHREATKEEKPEKKPKKKKDSGPPPHIIIGTGFINALKERREGILNIGGQIWRCQDLLWAMLDDKKVGAWLNGEIEHGYRTLNLSTTQKLISEARSWVLRVPEIQRDSIEWDTHKQIPTKSGLIDPKTLVVTPIEPEHYATYRIETEYDPAAKCPWWEHVLDAVFQGDKETIGLVQEVSGVSLLESKPKALMRALVLVGQSNSGKSNILDVLGGLLTDNPITTPFDMLETSHGTMDFLRRAPWVLHEAFSVGTWNPSSKVKGLLSGDDISINVKNGPQVSHKYRAPVFWGANSEPKFKEATKAIENRLVILQCKNVFDPAAPTEAMIEAQKQGYSKPSELILATEKAGLLNWAIVGMQRALARGAFPNTSETQAAAKALRYDSNPVAEFFDECCTYNPNRIVSRADFYGAFNMFWEESHGGDRRMLSPDMVGRSLGSLYDKKIAVSKNDLRYNQQRYYAGFELNDLGMTYWDLCFKSSAVSGSTARISSSPNEVNKDLPEGWENKDVIKTLRKAQGVE